MIKRIFSFSGRIHRTEYWISSFIFNVWYLVIDSILDKNPSDITVEEAFFVLLTIIPMFWFIFAQGCKRCHDMGKSGWIQLIPFYNWILLFKKGEEGPNKYDSEI